MRPRLPFLPATLVVASLLLVACTDDTPTADSPPVDISPDGSAAEPASLPDDEPALAPNATVERVVDGDTIVVELQGQRERVRLLGIDTPESVAEDRPDQCYGAEAGAYLTDLLPVGTDVALVRDVEPRDQYDRLLAYVVRTDDQLFVNLDLVDRGFAATLVYPPNDHYADVLRQAERAAVAAGAGLWGVCGGPDVPLG